MIYGDYIIENNIDKIKELLDQGWDPSEDDNYALVITTTSTEIIKLLLQDERVKISDIKKSTRWLLDKDHLNRIIKINRELKLEKLLQHEF